MLQTISLESLCNQSDKLAVDFRRASPFPHLVIDNFLVPAICEPLKDAFPSDAWEPWQGNAGVQDKYQPLKRTCDRIDQIPEPLDRLIMELNSGPFMDWLEKTTGISNLLPDASLFGGGLHSTSPGGKLAPHIDFHFGRNRLLHRRLNLLVYLNDGWRPEFNGALELWDQQQDCIAHEVFPELGRAVLFQTDANSLHGFSKPLLERSRQSVAMYYYTVEAPTRYSGDNATHWRSEGEHGTTGLIKKTRKSGAKFCARALGGIAWRLNALSNKFESLADREFA